MPLINEPIDWKVDADNNLVIPLEYVTGLDAIVQAIRVQLQIFQGEWFLDLGIGIPYLEDEENEVSEQEAILGQPVDPVRVRAAFRREILTVPGVKEITQLKTSFDGEDRVLNVTWAVSTEFGDSSPDVIAVRVAV